LSQAALAHEKDEAVARASALQAVVERNMAALQAAQQKLAGFKVGLMCAGLWELHRRMGEAGGQRMHAAAQPLSNVICLAHSTRAMN
jgi:hypothetical protein